MVDAFVSFAVQKLGDFLIQQAGLRLSLTKDVKDLQDELQRMQSFLKDAEEKQVGDHRVQHWVFEIKSLADDAVAILETYNFVAGEGDGHGFASRLKTCACICRKETKFYKVSKKIQSLNKRIKKIAETRQTYGIRDINNEEGPNNYRPNNQTSGLRRTTSYMEKREQNFVGFEEVVEKLHAELDNAELRRTVISIYGMGGSGKTTLAKHLYHSPRLTNIFSARGWVCVSQQYNITDLLKNVIRSIKEYDNETVDWLEKMTDVTVLERRLQSLLKNERYLVVVDDVWQREAWESLERAFPDTNKGSRVIITTRKQDVAKRADDNCLLHRLRSLTEEESWALFRKLLNFEVMTPDMETLARDMVGKCEGLPLAIAALSGLLSYKKELEEWERVKEHLWNHVKTDCKEIPGVLSLSYNDLSTVLKHCFLYFGIFPEDREIDAENLMWLWMADGLIPRGEAERMEDVAQDFLNELIRRSLVQVVSTPWQEVTTCRIHDLLRDLAIEKASEVNFFDTYGPRKHSISSSCRRHTIHGQVDRYLTLNFSKLNLRSVTFFDQKVLKLDRIKFHNMFQHLYVLYLENGSATFTLPDAIGSLYSLRYLGFTASCHIPSSIGNLKNLLTLQAFKAGFCLLSPEIANLVNLRHLLARYSRPLQHITKLTSLQVLGRIYCDQWRDVNPVDLVDLRELSMNVMKYYSLNNISSLKSLGTLQLVSRDSGESLPALEFLSSCQKLQKLLLDGRIENLPPFPNSITMMTLSRSYLKEDPMPILGMLPNLRDLQLSYEAYEGKEITCSDNSFIQLEFLHLGYLDNLERWHLAASAMPLIKGLSIIDCPNLKEIPQRMKEVERF